MKKILLLSALVFLLIASGIGYTAETTGSASQYGAQIIDGIDFMKNIKEFIMPKNGDLVEEVRRLFYDNLLPMFLYLFAFASILIWTLYVVGIITASGSTETLNENRKNLIWGLVGFILIALAVEFGDALTPVDNGSDIVNIDETGQMIRKVVAYLQLIITIIAIGTIFYAGANLVRSGGEEDDISTSKKLLTYSVLGMLVAMLASPMVDIFYPPNGQLGGDQVTSFAAEFASFLGFVLIFLAIGAFITLLVAGFYYITSLGDTERQENARKIIFGTLLGIVVILTAYAIVNFFVPA